MPDEMMGGVFTWRQMRQSYDEGYHLGYADGEGSMENITPNSAKWRSIFDEGWNGAWKTAKDQVLFLHKPGMELWEWDDETGFEDRPPDQVVESRCKHCYRDWPCPTALIFMPELLPEPPLPDLSEGPF